MCDLQFPVGPSLQDPFWLYFAVSVIRSPQRLRIVSLTTPLIHAGLPRWTFHRAVAWQSWC